jgi:short-chain Z-isoprenyl diphosphate synthase
MSNLIYRFYEKSLERQLEAAALPKHVGVILDGNRRWAERQPGTTPREGHAAGAAKIQEFLGWCADLGIEVVTLYLLSTNNLSGRPSSELDELLEIIAELTRSLSHSRAGKIKWVGDAAGLPEELVATLKDAERKTKTQTKLHINLAVGYGGRQEIADAMRAIVKKHAKKSDSFEALAETLTPELIAKHLYTGGQPDPDLVIRTSGEQRISDFLLWQSAHSEFYFEEALWPDFRRIDFLRALRSFELRHRRFGS